MTEQSKHYWNDITKYHNTISDLRARKSGRGLFGILGLQVQAANWHGTEPGEWAGWYCNDIRRIIPRHDTITTLMLSTHIGTFQSVRQLEYNHGATRLDSVTTIVADWSKAISIDDETEKAQAAISSEPPELRIPQPDDYDALHAQLRLGASGVRAFVPENRTI